MAKNLVIVESPAKCRTISRYLGKDYSVKATMGHIIDLPEKELGVDITHDFKPKYAASKGKRRIIKSLREDAGKAEAVFLAPDPDREGEAIAWHVTQTIAKNNTNVKRVLFNEITKRAVVSAFDHPQDIDMHKVNAQQARRILDRIVGYQVSPVLWRTVFRGLSAGRVQSVALRLICEREDEINAFKQEEYWSITAAWKHGESTYTAKLHHVDGEKASLPNEAAAKAILERVQGKQLAVTDVARTEKTRKPYPPFITSTLQQEAARKLGFSAAKTMLIAQQLYEGLELGDLGTQGLITYMRTDSTRVADEAVANARKVVTAMFDAQHLPDAPRTFGKKKGAQDAHEAIRPAQVALEFEPANVKKHLSRDQFRLYQLVWKRFLASQMANALFDFVRVDLSAEGCVFRSTGSVLKFDGFLAMYDETTEEGGDDEGKNDRLPDIQAGIAVDVKELIDRQHFTQPPPRYSEASLVRELEDKGIGRPSTYAQIIDTLKRRKYVEVSGKRFTPTEVGFMVRKILIKEFPEVFDVGFTAEMEGSLDKVERGDADWVGILKEFYGPFSKRLEAVKGDIKKLRAENQEVTDRTCPECNKFPLVIKWSKNGKFLACQGFPACKYTEPLQKIKTVETDEICDKCGAKMVILNIKNNRFLGCSRYPECKNTRSLSTGVPCPVNGCPGMLIERNTRRGKVFFGCSAHPACNYATWDRPVNEECPTCHYPILVHKETKRKGSFNRCPKCKTEYSVAPPAEHAAEA
ncbi:MAG: type I DNA topoisomerase [Chitinivibrionales bacterium]|nr:type I DNA topoisomerase [Chitinivibrionales bacterium]MBD3394885.1 type I DNA topoisomerase [Chitinivibrionales bacterium]